MNDSVELKAIPTEGIRAWNKRKTAKAVRAMIGATALLVLVAALVWVFTPITMLQHAQTFNGALTIPGFGGLWIASFMIIWLIPMREVSFRGQESMERMEFKLHTTMDSKLIPALETWQRVGERMENVILPKLEKAIDRTEETVALLEKKGIPAVDIFRRIEANIQAELQTGLLQELRSAANSINFVMMSKVAPPVSPKVTGDALDILKPHTEPSGNNR